MSSLVYKDGKAVVYVKIDNGRRRPIRFGECSKTQANIVHDHVNGLESRKNTGSILRPSTAEWLMELPDMIYRRIVKTDLILPRERKEDFTLSAWLKIYLESRPDVKPGTKTKYDQVQKKLIAFFGEKKILSEISAGDAEDFRIHIKKDLSEGTTRRLCGIAKQFFQKAKKKRIITENPFEDISCANFADPSKFHFVTVEESAKILKECPDLEWELIFALCRYGALRCPSEVLRLKWGDIDWAQERFTVHACKTEHHVGGGVRIVPIFPELYPFLEVGFRKAQPGTEYVINRYRDPGQNLRTQFERIILKAKVKPWEKLFVNLRSTRVTELNEIFPGHVVAAWAGHSEAVERKHYLQVTEDHFKKAVRNPVRPPVKSDGMGCNTEIENRDIHAETAYSTVYQEMQEGGLGVIGLEPMTSSTSRKRSSQLS